MSKGSIISGQLSGNVNFSTTQKMIHRLLTHDRIKTTLDDGRIGGYKQNDKLETKVGAFTKKELAEKLGVSLEELDKLKTQSFYDGMANKISLPLISLYCATKFAGGVVPRY